jgi:hypothetical protein
MSAEDDFWAAHDEHRRRVNAYLTLALDERFDQLQATMSADFGSLLDDARFGLIVGLVGALATITEQAADAGGSDVADYLQHHLLDVEEMIDRRRQE